MKVYPNAKINIGLNIIEKRSDGFHNIESCFYPIPYFDELEIQQAKKTSFKSAGIEIPGNAENNLCLKAFYLLANNYNIPPVSIMLHKYIPIGAGLGGGSADAAFTLKMLNEANGLQLSADTLENFARKLGSDCAFFIDNKSKFCVGKGDDFEEISLDLKGKYLALIYPNIHISTAEAYQNVVPKTGNNLKAQLQKPIDTWKQNIVNDFEIGLFEKYPVLGAVKKIFYEAGAQYASMSGSGSSVYGIFDFEPSTASFTNFDVKIMKLS